VKVNYDKESDVSYLIVKNDPMYDSKELNDDARIEYDNDGQITGIEVFNTRNNPFNALSSQIAENVRLYLTPNATRNPSFLSKAFLGICKIKSLRAIVQGRQLPLLRG
jgi:uncharacterized protein YuzE